MPSTPRRMASRIWTIETPRPSPPPSQGQPHRPPRRPPSAGKSPSCRHRQPPQRSLPSIPSKKRSHGPGPSPRLVPQKSCLPPPVTATLLMTPPQVRRSLPCRRLPPSLPVPLRPTLRQRAPLRLSPLLRPQRHMSPLPTASRRLAALEVTLPPPLNNPRWALRGRAMACPRRWRRRLCRPQQLSTALSQRWRRHRRVTLHLHRQRRPPPRRRRQKPLTARLRR